MGDFTEKIRSGYTRSVTHGKKQKNTGKHCGCLPNKKNKSLYFGRTNINEIPASYNNINPKIKAMWKKAVRKVITLLRISNILKGKHKRISRKMILIYI